MGRVRKQLQLCGPQEVPVAGFRVERLYTMDERGEGLSHDWNKEIVFNWMRMGSTLYDWMGVGREYNGSD